MTMSLRELPRPTTSRSKRVRMLRHGCSVLVAFSMAAVSHTSIAEAAPPLAQAVDFEAGGLAEGSVGPRVSQVQDALIERGAYLPGGADGVWGAATTKALADFQTWNGLHRTGSLNDATVRRLGLSSDTSSTSASMSSDTAASGGTSASGASSSSYASLTLGSQGQLVVDVQRALLDTGLVIEGGADGVYGQATARAVRAFQRVNGMTETGAMSERVAQLLDPESSAGTSTSSRPASTSTNTSSNGGWTQLERFPVQGNCAYGDTWHAPRGGGRVHEGVDVIAAQPATCSTPLRTARSPRSTGTTPGASRATA